jgi:two-component system, sensor histidine kinase and response regulator
MAENKGVILVVDDTPSNVIILIDLLQDEGYIIHEARDGQAAVELVPTVAPDLILMDINMPRLNGFEACRRLKSNSATQDIPVVFISAWGELDDKINGFKAGGVDYITRPFQVEEVIARVRTHITIAKQHQQIMALNRLKDQLVRTVSHDLKNPLTGVRGYVDMLIEDETSADRQRMLTLIRRSADRMYRLISNLLDLTRIQDGLQLERRSVLVSQLIQDALNDFEVQAQSRQIHMTMDLPNGDLSVSVDPLRMGQVIANLLSNAVKYATRQVIVRGERIDDRLHLAIVDDGPGIPPEMQARLFEAFYRAPTQTNKQVEGTGLGLSIAQGIVQQHGGIIRLHSVVNEGTMFEVVIPLA